MLLLYSMEQLPESYIVDIYCKMDATDIGNKCEFMKGEVRTADGREFVGYFTITDLKEVQHDEGNESEELLE